MCEGSLTVICNSRGHQGEVTAKMKYSVEQGDPKDSAIHVIRNTLRALAVEDAPQYDRTNLRKLLKDVKAQEEKEEIAKEYKEQKAREKREEQEKEKKKKEKAAAAEAARKEKAKAGKKRPRN